MAKKQEEHLVNNCIMPEMSYCPSCKYGRIEYPEWVETHDDTYNSGCEWVCSLKSATTSRSRLLHRGGDGKKNPALFGSY